VSGGPPSDAALFATLRLARAENVGPRTFRTLVTRFGSAAAAVAALPELVARQQTGRPIVLPEPDAIKRELEAAAALGITYLTREHPLYPPRLAAIDGAPVVLAAQGRLAVLARPSVAIVGARNASAVGLAMAERLARGLGQAGFVVVSGLARGIDARAHRATLETGTIAVLAGGLDKPYPAEHAGLLERLLETGAALSEMPLGWTARGRDFPRRNRIVSGLSQGTIVVEAARRSGSLITARFAAEQGRDVFAVPGSPLDPRAEGPNDLLRDGAILCTSVDDVLSALAEAHRRAPLDLFGSGTAEDEVDAFELEDVATPSVADIPVAVSPKIAPVAAMRNPDAGDAERVLGLLGPTPVSLDLLVRAAELPARHIRSILLQLELDGRLQRHSGDLVSRV
jgi:DNA processing protein